MSLNEDILQLQKGYKTLKDSTADQTRKDSMKKSTDEIAKRVQEKKEKLKIARNYMICNPDMMEESKRKKYMKLTDTTIETAEKCLDLNSEDDNLDNILDQTVTEVQETIREDNTEEDSSLANLLDQL